MYGIFTCICLIFMVQVGEYTTHGWYGIYYFKFPQPFVTSFPSPFLNTSVPGGFPEVLARHPKMWGKQTWHLSFSGRGLAPFQRSGNPSKRCRTGYVKFSDLPDRGIPGLFEQRGGRVIWTKKFNNWWLTTCGLLVVSLQFTPPNYFVI